MKVFRSRLFVKMLEIFPGTLTWFILLFPFIFSFWFPEIVAVFIIFYTLLWFFRSIVFSIYLIQSYKQASLYNSYDWPKLLSYFNASSHSLDQDIENEKNSKFASFLKRIQKRQTLLKQNGQYKSNENIRHVVIIATYKEPLDILRYTIESVKISRFDLQKIVLVLATEERDKENALANAKALENEFGNSFGSFHHIMHPKDLPAEIPGKGGNITYAGRKIAEILKSQGLDFSDIIVTTLDADNRVHPNYFSNLSFYYLMTPDRKKKSYQPLPLFYNNIWNVPLLNRLAALSSSFWHVIESGRPDRLRNFSSHAQGLEALYEMDFWSTQTIVEDGHQYWRSYFHFDGDYAVIPTFIPIYQDAVENESYIKSIVCQYLQLRRWAWGCSDIPFVIQNMIFKGKKISFWKNMHQLFNLIEGHLMWATAPIIITMAPFVPSIFNEPFGQTVIAHNVAIVLAYIYSLALVGILVSMWVSLLMVPKPPKNWWLRVSSLFQWIFLPITTILFGALPAIDAQTRLLLNKRLDFNVTEKVRKTAPPTEVRLERKRE